MIKVFKWFQRRKKKPSDEYMNVVTGMGKARSLYRRLVTIAHPDRHPNEEERYTEIMNRITANRYNYNELLKIKEEITSEKQEES